MHHSICLVNPPFLFCSPGSGTLKLEVDKPKCLVVECINPHHSLRYKNGQTCKMELSVTLAEREMPHSHLKRQHQNKLLFKPVKAQLRKKIVSFYLNKNIMASSLNKTFSIICLILRMKTSFLRMLAIFLQNSGKCT